MPHANSITYTFCSYLWKIMFLDTYNMHTPISIQYYYSYYFAKSFEKSLSVICLKKRKKRKPLSSIKEWFLRFCYLIKTIYRAIRDRVVRFIQVVYLIRKFNIEYENNFLFHTWWLITWIIVIIVYSLLLSNVSLTVNQSSVFCPLNKTLVINIGQFQRILGERGIFLISNGIGRYPRSAF